MIPWEEKKKDTTQFLLLAPSSDYFPLNYPLVHEQAQFRLGHKMDNVHISGPKYGFTVWKHQDKLLTTKAFG
jgi:hypothetical protein